MEKTAARPNGQPRFIEHLGLVAAVLLAVVFSLLSIGKHSLGLDEAISLYISREWSAMWDVLLKLEANMWLYYLVLNFWQHLGSSEFIVRGLSALFAVGTVPVVWALGRRMFDSRVAFVAAFLTALNLYMIEYAQEARGYTLLLLLSTLSSLYFVRAVEESRLRDWLIYAVVSALGVYTHLFAILIIGAHGVSLSLAGWKRIPWKMVIGSGAVMIVLLVPLALYQSLGTGQADWIVRPSFYQFLRAFRSLAGSSPLLVWFLPLCIMAVLAGWQAIRRSHGYPEAWRISVLLCWLILPVLVTYAFSLTIKPMFVERYFISGISPLVLLAALGLDRIRSRWVVMTWAVLFVVLTTRGLVELYGTPGHEDWRSAAQLVAERGENNDAVMFYAYFAKIPFEYYFPEQRAHTSGITLLDIASGPWRGAKGHTSDLPDPNREEIENLSTRFNRVWLVLAHENFPNLGRDVEAVMIKNLLSHDYTPHATYEFEGIRMILYIRPPAGSDLRSNGSS